MRESGPALPSPFPLPHRAPGPRDISLRPCLLLGRSPVCGSWCQAFGSPSRKLCSSPQHQLCLGPPHRAAVPPQGSVATPVTGQEETRGAGRAGRPPFTPLSPCIWNPPQHPSPASSSPWGPSSHVRSCVPTGALTSTLLDTGRQEGAPYTNLNSQVTPCLDPPGASPCAKSKATRLLGAHEALGPPSVPGTNPALMGLWPQWLPLGPSVIPLPQGLCTCRPLWPVSPHSDSRIPPLGPPTDLPLSAVSPSPGVN